MIISVSSQRGIIAIIIVTYLVVLFRLEGDAFPPLGAEIPAPNYLNLVKYNVTLKGQARQHTRGSYTRLDSRAQPSRTAYCFYFIPNLCLSLSEI